MTFGVQTERCTDKLLAEDLGLVRASEPEKKGLQSVQTNWV